MFVTGKPTFGFGDGLDEDGLDQSGGSYHGSQGSPGSQGERIERFSRKVFVGGLPPDIDEGTLNYCLSWVTIFIKKKVTLLSEINFMILNDFHAEKLVSNGIPFHIFGIHFVVALLSTDRRMSQP